MEREIKFRGKRVDNGEWVEGALFDGENSSYILHHILANKSSNVIQVVGYEVDPETVGQFTGLKDKNGKEIYEGDRVNVKTIQYQFNNYVVEYFGTQYVARSLSPNQNGIFSAIPLSIDFEHEIIGNIWDDKNLLRGEQL